MSTSVLIIDDDPLIQNIIRRTLEPNGFTTQAANEGESGIKKAIEIKPDIILLDVEMPGATGYEVCERLRNIEEFRETPIVFLSAQSSLQQRLQGYEVGADDYLTKPFEMQELIARLKVLGAYQHDRYELRAQYRLAQSTARIAISGTSEIAVAMAYMEKSIGYTSVTETIEGLLETLDRLDMDCALQVVTDSGKAYFASEGTISPLEHELLDLTNKERRFMDFGRRTLVHFSSITILIKNMPLDDMERYGRIKDLIPVLLSAADTKLNALVTHEALVDQSHDLKQAFDGIRKNLFELAELIINNRKRGVDLMSNTITELEVDLADMNLDKDQEVYLLNRIKTSINKSLVEQDVGCRIKDSLSFVMNSLEDTMLTHDALLDAFNNSQANLAADSSQSDDGIELF